MKEKMNDCTKKDSDRILKLENSFFDASCDLEKAKMALGELRQYDWSHKPDPAKAIEYMETTEKEKRDALGEDAEHSFEYIFDYKRIMWLVEVALDYCCSALDRIDNTL